MKKKRIRGSSLLFAGLPKTYRIMKLICLFTFIALLQVSASSYSQSTKLNISGNNLTLEEVFEQIEDQSEFSFIYNLKQINLSKKVNVDFKNQAVEKILKKILRGTNITYTVNNRLIVVHRDGETINLGSSFDQQKSITGKVTDNSGDPLPGVTVIIKGTSNGTITNFEGEYSISGIGTETMLQFSFVGMVLQEIVVGTNTSINIEMIADAIGIEEVVAIGYGIQKKVNLTGAITSIKMEELDNMPITNLSNALAGRAPGVNVINTSGLTGASSSIRIRGSFGEPLYVIDGIIRDKEAFDALDGNEVEQLSFLKDAASASIYGSSAGNGVVLVKTKTGTIQKPQFEFRTSYTTSRPTQTLLSDLTTATDELIYQNRVAQYKGIAEPNGAEEFAYFENRSYNVHDMIWRNPNTQKYSLSVNGGNDKIKYYALAGYLGEEGSYKNLDYAKFNLRSNVTAQITESVKFGFNLSANQQNHDRFYWPFSADSDNDVEDLYRVTFNWPKVYPFYTTEDGTPSTEITEYPVQTPMGSWQAWSVIDQIVGDRYVQTRKRQMNSKLSLDIDLNKFIPGLSTRITGSYGASDYMEKKFLTFQENYVFIQAQPDVNRFISGAPDPNKINTFTFGHSQPTLTYELNTKWDYQLNWFLDYKRTFDKHTVTGLLVYEQAENGGYSSIAEGEDPVTNYDQMFVYSSDSERRYGNAWEWTGARQSVIGRANYNYAGKYIAEFSFRYDGNTLFPKDKRWGFFPSVSAGWRISEEAFLKNTENWLNNLKLRASYGTTGNDLNVHNQFIGTFKYANTYNNAGSYIYGDKLYTTIEPGATPNPDLTWATNTSYNIGFDMAFLNNRLSATLDGFYKKEVDILGTRIVTLPDTYGQALAPENYAARSWRGGELFATWKENAFSNTVKYSIYGNIGYAKDQWDDYDEQESFKEGNSRAWESRIGQPNNRLFGLRNIGMVRTQEQLDELLATGLKQFGRDPYLGGLIFEDIRGDDYSEGPDGKIDNNDWDILSNNATPRINYGFGFNVEWKRITVETHFQGVGAYDRMIGNQEGGGLNQYGGSVRPYYPLWAGDVWTPDNTDSKYPRPIGKSWYESGGAGSSFWIRNGAYLRLKNLNIAYSLPKSIINRVALNEAKIFFTGTNLFVFSAMTELHDPEQKSYDSYPLMKSFTFGLQVKF